MSNIDNDCTTQSNKQLSFINSRDRLDIAECLQHKWLAEDASPHLELCPSLTTAVPSSHNSSYSISNHHEKMNGSHSNSRTSIQDNSKESSPSPDHKRYETRRTIVTEEVPYELGRELRDSVSSVSTLTTTLKMNTSVPSSTSTSSSPSTSAAQLKEASSSTQQQKNNNKENISTLTANISGTTLVSTQNIVKMKSVELVERQSISINLFPDAPTTPKVCRKAPPDSPPASVKALVQKFQQQQHHQQQQKQQLKQLHQEDSIDNVDSAAAAAYASCISTTACHPECGAGVCGGAAGVHNVGRKSLAGIEQGIIC